MNLYRAIKIAKHVHGMALDKSGKPYIRHPLTVMALLESEQDMMAAVLHDTLEDGDYNEVVHLMRDVEIPEAVIRTVKILTHTSDESYRDYIIRISESNSSSAVRVKIEDLEHNMDLARLPRSTRKDIKRALKYLYSQYFLKGRFDKEWYIEKMAQIKELK
jgi:GTP diphosphokinase / guanosine-3',5'-bis(diphosphate) 3'-diphosphatase